MENHSRSDNYNLQAVIEGNLAIKLGIPELRAGNITIRDERDWRINERHIEYCWLVNVSRSFIGWCWIFSIKFSNTNFRENKNPEALIQGIFTNDKDGAINHFFSDDRKLPYTDVITKLTSYDMFDANTGITLDGVGYEYIVYAPNTEIRININNPNSQNWKIWEKCIWVLGKELSQKSGSKELIEIFK